MTRTLILGAAVSGRAAARLAGRLGHEVTVYDRSAAALRDLESVATVSGEWDRRVLAGHDLVVTSPGIPQAAPPVVDALASGIEFMSELEFAYRRLEAPCAAVTGTNGKTTTTTAAAEMLSATGIDAVAAGNIGLALSDVADAGHGVVVVEASSFQLQFVASFRPEAAAILNVSPDHLDWHGTAADYAAAKRRIGERQTPEDIIVFDADDPGAVAAVESLPARHVPVSGRRRPVGGNGPDGPVLLIADMEMARPDLDAAFTMDLVAAGTLAHHLGAAPSALEKVIAGFEPVTHRRTVVGTWGGVSWVNDSKATNPHAAMAAATAYDSVVLIAGGRNKGLDLSPLPQIPSVRVLIGIGEASDELEAASRANSFHRAATLEEAVALADALAEPGETVLLAPGCASFDMFDDYQHRGRVFTDVVRRQKGN
jgi:UDP-N-acetylmuramoylalanine--D-glutamate ligase